ncbi:MAG: hypothetical protein ONB48_00510 [candidate division KSB1 bacterium]|nr:hypothetical protein [candidate division KSB1 bacterium]MDZ7272842.1 hypothetical protein [candidate division KSB1 bacterium]MDZ7284135.1 hypothetical protein [candidate division KSB1 bacterium]MDZ7297467.1 hypothetical protein [candidate division KSB1 bacterium]MDZ7305603.1 hypothetical protein [candidate division KSB1 bacterium]
MMKGLFQGVQHDSDGLAARPFMLMKKDKPAMQTGIIIAVEQAAQKKLQRFLIRFVFQHHDFLTGVDQQQFEIGQAAEGLNSVQNFDVHIEPLRSPLTESDNLARIGSRDQFHRMGGSNDLNPFPRQTGQHGVKIGNEPAEQMRIRLVEQDGAHRLDEDAGEYLQKLMGTAAAGNDVQFPPALPVVTFRRQPGFLVSRMNVAINFFI